MSNNILVETLISPFENLDDFLFAFYIEKNPKQESPNAKLLSLNEFTTNKYDESDISYSVGTRY
jgi:hypothetical protein